MKYMNEGGFQNNPLMRLTLGLTVLFLSAFWISSWGMYFQRMSLHPASVVEHYNGNEENFRAPLTMGTMIETTHMHMPMMGMVLLFLTHLLIFIPLTKPIKIGFIVATFISALLDEGAGWLVRFVDPLFAPLKVIGFLGLQAAIGFLLITLALYLWRASREQRRMRNHPAEEEIIGPPQGDISR